MALSKKTSSDSAHLARLGKVQVLKRRFGFWSLLGFAVCELITWETVLALFSEGFENGGPAGLIYGYIIAWASTLSVYTVISEMASLAPIAGGQYYWVYMLAPERYKVFSSYIVGWLTTLAWVATVAIQTLFAGTIMQGLIILSHEDSYTPKSWEGLLMAWLVIATGIFVNAVTPGLLPKFEIFIIVFHLAGFVAIIATLWACTDVRATSHFVWTTSLNEGGWPTQGLSYCIGFMGQVATFVGADASVHMAEEVEDAARNIPRAIITSMFINGAVGFIMMITLLYNLGDVDTVLETTTGYPFLQIFYDSVKSYGGATAMGAITCALVWCCAIGICTTASRMTWSFARDRGLPLSTLLSKVTPKKKIPVYALLMALGLSCLLHLIYLGSYTAFNNVVSLTINGFYCSYFIPAAFLLYHRFKGNIAPHRAGTIDGEETLGMPEEPRGHKSIGQDSDEIGKDDSAKDILPSGSRASQGRRRSSVAQAVLVWGPFHLPGWFGIINNAYACVYMIFVVFWSFWPPATPTNYQNMNYSVVVFWGAILFSIVWYFIRGKKEYHGPTVDEEVEAVMQRAGATIR